VSDVANALDRERLLFLNVDDQVRDLLPRAWVNLP
jgi:hypothetical protein